VRRNTGLDVVRATAIGLVLLAHWGGLIFWWLAIPWTRVLDLAGYFGVELFFALRGFLIGRAVHRRELVRQASAKLTDAGVEHGIIAAGTEPTPDAKVQVCSVQTVVNRLDTLGNVGLVIFDEAHHAVAATWRRLCDAIPQAKALGVTATPLRARWQGAWYSCWRAVR
jgi:Type III restriction enzyme, res subunit